MPSNNADPRNIGHPKNNVTISSNTESLLVANKLKIMSLNIFSLMPHIDELRIMISNEEPHIIGINETKIDPSIDDSQINVEGYDVIRKDRDLNGGGVALYIHKSLNFKQCDDLYKYEVEVVSAEIKVGNYKPFIVTSLYRPPDKPVSHFDETEALVSAIDNKNLEFIIIGDTNCNFMDKTDNDTKHLLKLMASYNLQQLITDYTRVTRTTKTCIDHILTNKLDTVLQSGVLPCGISDHDIVFMIKNLRVPKPKHPPKSLTVRNYKKSDAQEFQDDIEKLPLDQIRNVTDNANDMWLIWKAFFLDVLNKHAPIAQIKVQSSRLPYVTSDLRKLIRQRDYLRGKANKTGSVYLRQAFNQLKTKANQELYKARRDYYSKKVEQHKMTLRAHGSL